MLTTIALELGYEFTVKASVADVFGVLADVPTSASFYPGVDQLVDLGGNAYRWEMEKIGLPHLTLQTIYASRYTSNKAKGTVSWTPVPGEGNARVSGSWKITTAKPGTHVVLAVQAELDLPLPAMMKPVLHPLVQAEFERLTERYIDNLITRFGGEV
ncbi:MAG: SRPBCC family protein [Rhodoferax sp.]